MSLPPIRDDDANVLAAELAFGLLEPAEREEAQARIGHDAAFEALCRRWSERAALLALGTDEVPRPSLWTGVVSELGWAPPARGRRLWQLATALSSLAAAVLLVVLVRQPRGVPFVVAAPVSPPLVAVLTGKDTAAVMTVTISADRRHLSTLPHGLALAGRVPELWVIAGKAAPRSLGVVASNHRSVALAPAQAAGVIGTGVTLAVSSEPVGGSGTGAPTGPVILTGTVAAS